MSDAIDEDRLLDGLTYRQYRDRWTEQKDRPMEDAEDAEERRMLHYLNYNWDRQAHVHDRYAPSDAARAVLNALEEEQTWMVLTEPWCGDSAFLLPIIAELAAASDRVTLRILLRDDNLDVMDEYLTGGSRSIPKLVAFGADGEERFVWGPRPDAAAELFASLKADDTPKEQAIQTLVEHYEDGGWRDAEAEIVDAIAASAGVEA
jgi:thioredoxin-like negative regulator of GroEL